MSNAHRRKKDPEQVRQNIIDAAIQLGMDGGLPSVSLDQVAAAAGVTKGGLLHHFPNKQLLLEAGFRHLLADVQKTVDKLVAADSVPHGRFSRAYVQLAFDDELPDRGWTALWTSTIVLPAFARIWDDWIVSQSAGHGEDAGDLNLQAARYAADGVWGAILAQSPPPNLTALRDHLVAMTYR